MTDITVYHNAMSASSQKLRLALAEKRLTWRSEEIELLTGGQHAPAYRVLNPAGVVPTLVHGDAVLSETSAILEYLDDVFPEPPLRPADPVARHAMRRWMARLYEDHHRPNGMLSYAISARIALRSLPAEMLQAMLDAMPYVVRIDHMGIPAMLAPDRRPRLADWLRRFKARPSYDEAIERWVPAARREAMAKLGELAWPEVARHLRR